MPLHQRYLLLKQKGHHGHSKNFTVYYSAALIISLMFLCTVPVVSQSTTNNVTLFDRVIDARDSLQGISLAYAFDDGKAISKRTVQHYNIFGSRSIYLNGWKASAAHHPDNVDLDFTNLDSIKDKSFDKDDWQLYNLTEDFNERNNLAAKNPCSGTY
jgi:hypothetical protein